MIKAKDDRVTKYIIFFFLTSIALFGGVIKAPILSVNESTQTVTIKVNNIDLGVSGFAIQRLSKHNSSILKNLTVVSYDKNTRIATLKMNSFDQLVQNSLPTGKWKVKIGDVAILAFGYSRALLIAPNEEVYYRITQATKQLQWIHPDIFATILSFNGHPTPLKEDFNKMSIATSAGLIFFYLNQQLFTVDAKSMKVLNISKAVLKQDSLQLPFFTRVENINSNWFGAGSSDLEEYETYYFGLLIENNPQNKELQKAYAKYQGKR